jgi:ribosome-associated translation inhibitor RaiA
MAHSEAIAAHVEARAAALNALYDRMISCHVVVEPEGHQHRHGNRLRFTINVGLPGHEVIVSGVHKEDGVVEDAEASADRSFDEAERQVKDWSSRIHDHHGQQGHHGDTSIHGRGA